MNGGKGEDDTKEQELWIGVVPVEMDEIKASTGNQESFADAMVNRVRRFNVFLVCWGIFHIGTDMYDNINMYHLR